MVEVVWTAEALDWLREIHDHIASDSPVAAKRVVSGILLRTEQLRTFPESGALLQVSEHPLRMLLYGHYRIVYRIANSDRIEVIGVYHGSLDIARRLLAGSGEGGGDTINE